MSWLQLDGVTAVVTGAGGGIGRGVALELARCGAHVAVLDRSEAGARETVDLVAGLPGAAGAYAYAVDVTDGEGLAEVAAEVRRDVGPVSVLVNNAGILRSAPLADVDAEAWARVLDINLGACLRCAQIFGADMLEAGAGSIVHVASIAASQPQPNSGAYSPSKAAVAMLSRQLAFEWGPRGVRSNVVSPGLIRTPLSESFYAAPGVLEARSAAVPLQRVGAAADIADAVVWLASPRSGYVTGQEIVVDGGFSQTLMSHVPRPGF